MHQPEHGRSQDRRHEAQAADLPVIHGGIYLLRPVISVGLCLEVPGGRMIWRKHLEGELGAIRPMWHFGESPLVDGDRVICTPGGERGSMVFAFPATQDGAYTLALDYRVPSGELVDKGWCVVIIPGTNGYRNLRLGPFQLADKGRAIFKKHQQAVVTVQAVLKNTVSMPGMAPRSMG